MGKNDTGTYLEKQIDLPGEHAGPFAEKGLFHENSVSILDPHETKSPDKLKPTYRQQFLQSCQPEYDATLEAYQQIYPHPSDGPRHALETCRDYAYFALNRIDSTVKVMSNGCRGRWCPMCAGQKAKFARESVQQWVETLEKPRFLTLTLEHSENELLPQIEFLQDSFRRLRQRVFWKKRVFGGIWFLQVHRSKHDGCWHPHLHILLEGKYIDNEQLSDLWKLVTFGSYILKIKPVHDVEETAKYVARYSARPAVLSNMTLDDRIELIKALKGKRMCGGFGNAKVVTLTPPKIESDADWIHVGYYDTLVENAQTDKVAREILYCWSLDYPISDELFEAYTGRKIFEPFVTPKDPGPIQYLLDFYNST